MGTAHHKSRKNLSTFRAHQRLCFTKIGDILGRLSFVPAYAQLVTEPTLFTTSLLRLAKKRATLARRERRRIAAQIVTTTGTKESGLLATTVPYADSDALRAAG
jgi:hypothetical protein